MARYKPIDTRPRFIVFDLERQLLPGTFEHALCWLIDHEIDLSGATAYPPALLLKVVLFACSRGIERACREQINLRHNKRVNRFMLRGKHRAFFTPRSSLKWELQRLNDIEVADAGMEILGLCILAVQFEHQASSFIESAKRSASS